jgi:carboxymethylenebutenolidase
MKRTAHLLILVTCVFLAAPMVWSQDWAKQAVEKSTRHREWVTLTHDGRKVQAFVTYPAASDKRPVVLVIHEIFGMTDWVQEVSDEFAAAGYIAIAPDLLSGMGPNGGGTDSLGGQSAAIKAVSGLDKQQITADLQAAADYALKLPASNGKLYVAGFCWGGGESFRFATNRPDLQAAFVFYGTPPDKDAMMRIKAPVYGFYAGMDARVGATVPATVTDMKDLGKKYEHVTYDGAGHGFMRLGEDPNDKNDANKKAREEAWTVVKSVVAKSNKGLASGN